MPSIDRIHLALERAQNDLAFFDALGQHEEAQKAQRRVDWCRAALERKRPELAEV